MEVVIQPVQLSSLVAQLNFEIQEQIIQTLVIADPDCVIAWNDAGEEARLDIRSDTKMVEVRSIVVPVNVIDGTLHSISLSGARFELVGAWRGDHEQPWLRNHCFGEAGTLVFSLASFEPDHIKLTATTVADTISKYLEAQLETC